MSELSSKMTPLRREVMSGLMTTLQDALVLNAHIAEADDLHLQGYAAAEFETEGWIVRVQFTSRRAVVACTDGAGDE